MTADPKVGDVLMAIGTLLPVYVVVEIGDKVTVQDITDSAGESVAQLSRGSLGTYEVYRKPELTIHEGQSWIVEHLLALRPWLRQSTWKDICAKLSGHSPDIYAILESRGKLPSE